MSLFGLFPKKENHYETVSQILSSHEDSAKQNLNAKHPHIAPLLQKHGVDLSKIRRHGAKVATTATILGALLAFPHLIHAPTQHLLPVNQGTFQTKVLSDTSNSPVNNSTGQDGHHFQTSSQPASVTNAPPQNAIATTDKPEDNDNHETSNHDRDDHEHGRSEMAPPKEHGLHDLGYHEGAERNPDKVSSPGAHPEEAIEHGKGEI